MKKLQVISVSSNQNWTSLRVRWLGKLEAVLLKVYLKRHLIRIQAMDKVG